MVCSMGLLGAYGGNSTTEVTREYWNPRETMNFEWLPMLERNRELEMVHGKLSTSINQVVCFMAHVMEQKGTADLNLL